MQPASMWMPLDVGVDRFRTPKGRGSVGRSSSSSNHRASSNLPLATSLLHGPPATRGQIQGTRPLDARLFGWYSGIHWSMAFGRLRPCWRPLGRIGSGRRVQPRGGLLRASPLNCLLLLGPPPRRTHDRDPPRQNGGAAPHTPRILTDRLFHLLIPTQGDTLSSAGVRASGPPQSKAASGEPFARVPLSWRTYT